MPKKHKEPVKKRHKWDVRQMEAAVSAVKSGEMGYLKASKIFKVPQTTLERYVKKVRTDADKGIEQSISEVKLGRPSYLPPELETQLLKYCVTMESKFFGVSRRDICRYAFDLAKLNSIRTTFNATKKKAGRKWFYLFMRRHPELALRTPQATSAARVMAFKQEAVTTFFDLYEPEIDRLNLRHEPTRIWNVDETGITVVQHKHTEVITLKGKKRVGALTAQERGKLITVVCCMNAAGNFMPPKLIFPRKKKPKDIDLLRGAPPGSTASYHKSGWIQTEIFTEWLEEFIAFTNPTKERPVLLVLDGHYSHTRNIAVIELARKSHVSIVCLPPHCTHRMQPIDVSLMFAFKTYYAEEIENYQKKKKVVLNISNIGKVFGKAYLRAAKLTTAINGFKKTGLYPVDRLVFTDLDFAAEAEKWKVQNKDAGEPSSATTGSSSTPSSSNSGDKSCPTLSPSSNNSLVNTSILTNLPISTPLPNNENGTSLPLAQSPVTPVQSHFDVSILSVSPVKQPAGPDQTVSKPGRKRGSASIITSSPYKRKLEESLAKKSPAPGKRVKCMLDASNAVPSTSRGPAPQKKNVTSTKKAKEVNKGSKKTKEDADDVTCLICCSLYRCSKPGEIWIQCRECQDWAHEECADAGAPGENWTCDLCLDD